MMSFLNPPKKPTILVTGAASYLGSLIVSLLLNKDYIVRGTVRSLTKISLNLDDLAATTTSLRMKNLFLYEADLSDSEATWNKIIQGCDCIIHVAAPNGMVETKNYEKELIAPAVQGVETIYSCAINSNVKQIIHISCITTIVTSKKKNYVFKENDWAEVKELNKIALSKFRAEKKAWEIYEKNKDKFNLTSIVPGLMMGPSLKKDINVSMTFLQKTFENLSAVPRISFPIVDVRDVAQAAVLVVDNPISYGKRYLIVQGSYWWEDIVNILRGEFEKYGYIFPKKQMSTFWIKIASWWNSFLYFIKPYLDGELIIDTSLFINELGFTYRKIETTFIEFGYDMIKKKMIGDKLLFIGDDKDPPYLH